MSDAFPPKWFDIDKYKACENLTLAQWVDNFEFRDLAFRHIARRPPGTKDEWTDALINDYLMDFSPENPVIEDGHYATHGGGPPEPLSGQEGIPTSEADFSLVRPTQVWETLRAFESCDEQTSTQIKRLLASRFSELDEVTDNEDSVLTKALDYLHEDMWEPKSYLHVTVDLEATDKQVIEDFKKWLKEAREHHDMKTKRTFTAADMGKWASHQVLAYMDLKIWAFMETHKPTHQELGELLFPNNLNYEMPNKINQTVEPLARQVLKPYVLAAMEHQIGT
ncbi:MAG: DUF6387 family protein [Pseudomonadota bacterium]